MKKILCLILAVVCALLAVSCNHIPPEETTDIPQNQPDPSKVVIPIVYDSKQPTYGVTNDDPSNTDEVIITKIRSVPFNHYFSPLTVKRNQATSLIALLDDLQPTGFNAKAIFDESFNLNGEVPEFLYRYYSHSPIWLETNDKIYRIIWEEQSKDVYIPTIALVETHYGEGIYLQITDELIKMINAINAYWPYDYWYGTYDSSKSEALTMEHLYAADSPINIIVKSIVFDKGEKFYDLSGRLILEITAQTDQELDVGIKCQQSIDFFGTGDSEKVMLQANVPQTVELSFSMEGIDQYYITLLENNTYIRIVFWNLRDLYSE